jgi:UDP:flavonoid glycosyltransferase YjiC (YdhE family)
MSYVLFAVIPAIGHVNPLLQQAREMQRRGWRVALAVTEDLRHHVERTAPDIPFLSVGTVPEDLKKQFEELVVYTSREPNMLKGSMKSTKLLVNALWPILFDGLVSLIRSDRPDLMVVDNATLAGIDAAEAEGIPFIINNPDLLSFLPYTLFPPAHHLPIPFSGVSIHSMTPARQYLQRLASPVIRLFAATLLGSFNRRLNACRATRGLPARDHRYRLKNTMVMTNCTFGLEYKRQLPPLIQMVGPMLEENIETLPDEYRDWLANGPPVVYVNMGTIALPPEEQLRKMMTALQSDAFRVLWILKQELQTKFKPGAVPANVRIESWGPPPRAILAHPGVRVFVSHCGINSVHESIHAGTPIVGIPMFADQKDMAMRVQDAGVGLMLDKTSFTTEKLRDAIDRVMNDAAFRSPIAAIQESFREAGGIKRAADIIEAQRA